jgi:hypothetical protein
MAITAGRIVILDEALCPQVDAFTVMVPGFFAWRTPAESTIATDVSDDVKEIGTSVRAFPTRLIAVAVNLRMSAAFAGDLTVIDAFEGVSLSSLTGFVTSQIKPGPESVSSVHADAKAASARMLTAQMTFNVMQPS